MALCVSSLLESHVPTHAFCQKFTPPDELLKSKSQKQLILTGAARFNTKPKGGVTFLEEKQLIYTNPDEPRPLSLAKFLKSCSRLDKRLLGDYLSKPDNVDLLKAFMGLFDFKDVSQKPCGKLDLPDSLFRKV